MVTNNAHLHLLANTLRNRHSSDTTRLRASDYAEPTVPVFIQELRELSGLPRTGLTDHDDDYTWWSGGRHGIPIPRAAYLDSPE